MLMLGTQFLSGHSPLFQPSIFALMKKALIFLALSSLSALLVAQITYQKRLEFELKDEYTGEKITAFGKQGFIMTASRYHSTIKQTEWKYDLYNTQLEQIDTRGVFLPKKMGLDETYSDEERIHRLFKDKLGNFSIVTIEAATLAETIVEGQVPKKSRITEMAILGDYAIFKASIKRSPHLFTVNWKTGKTQTIPIIIKGLVPQKTSLFDLQILPESREIFAYIYASVGRRKSDIYVIRLNENGEKEGIFNLTKDIDHNIVAISASKLSEDVYAFTGTYSSKSTSMAEGLFFCQADGENIDFIEFHNFLDLENFLTYLPQKRKDKLEKKKIRKEEKGKELKISYQIAAHEVIKIDDGFLFLGEAYYPTYRTETTTSRRMINGVSQTVTSSRQVFDGYQYTHAILGRFSDEGDLLWDETFELWSARKPYHVKRFISIQEQNPNSIKLAFASRNRIYTREIDFTGAVIQDDESDPIELTYEGDKMRRSYSDIDYWYGHYFLAYGRQKIKNKEDEEVKKKRWVYFISKIKYD